MMSMNNVQEIRELFGDFFIEEITTSYTMSGTHEQKKVTELLIRNYA